MQTSQFLKACLVGTVLICITDGEMKRTKKRRNRCGPDVERNITALWEKVNMLSVPVHVHVHGVSTEGDLNVEEEEMVKEKRYHMMEEEFDEESRHGRHHENKHVEDPLWLPVRGRHGHGVDQPDGQGVDSEEVLLEEDDSGTSSEEEEDERKKNSGPNIHIHLNIGEHRQRGQRDYREQREHREHREPKEHREHRENREERREPVAIPRTNEPHHHERGHSFGDYIYPEDHVYARCDMLPNAAYSTDHEIRGSIYFRQRPAGDLEVNIDLYGFSVRDMRDRGSETRLHGFHLHEFGDYSNGCNSFGGHYNPLEVLHGGPEDHHKHAGDWGNLESDFRGIVKGTMTIKHSTLFGPYSIAGRGVVVHESVDDHGRGDAEASKTSGNAGSRVACCIIGYAKGVW